MAASIGDSNFYEITLVLVFFITHMCGERFYRSIFFGRLVHTLNSYSCRLPLMGLGSVIGHNSLLLRSDDVERAREPPAAVCDVISWCAASTISTDVIPVASDNSLRKHSTSM